MKKSNATISIKSICSSDDDVIELICDGAFYEKNGNWYIMYDEKEEMGMANCSVMIKVTQDEVTVTRKGDFSSRMVYKSGCLTEFIYYMPYGSLPVILNTHKTEYELDKSGGFIKLEYTLSIQEENHVNSMTIKIKSDN